MRKVPKAKTKIEAIELQQKIEVQLLALRGKLPLKNRLQQSLRSLGYLDKILSSV